MYAADTLREYVGGVCFRLEENVRRSAKLTLFLMAFLVSCASPVQTSTSMPVVQATFTASPTETPAPIPTSTFTPEPTFNWSSVPMDIAYTLTDEDEASLGLDPTGAGIAVRTEAGGVPMDIVLLMSDRLLELTDGKGIALNANSDSIKRLAEAIQLGDYFGWQEDDPSRANLTLEQFLSRVAAGEDMSYKVMGNPIETNVNQQVEIDPSAPVKVVFQAVGETDNGNLWIHSTAKFGFGIYVDEDGTRQYVIFLPDEKGKPGSKHYSMNVNLAYMLALLGQPERMQSSGVDIMDFDLKNDEVFQGKFDEIFVKMAYSDINSPTFTFGKMAIVPAK